LKCEMDRVLKLQVLKAFKDLHTARLNVFKNDQNALRLGRDEINKQFQINKDVTDPGKIKELIVVAQDSANILRKHVLQLEKVDDDSYSANVTPDTYMVDNTPYRDVSDEELLSKSRKNKNRPRKRR